MLATIVFAMCMVGAGCGSGGATPEATAVDSVGSGTEASGPEDSSTPISTATGNSAESTTSVSVVGTTTTFADKGLVLSDLPGRIAFSAFSCEAGPPTSFEVNDDARICIMNPDATDVVEVVAPDVMAHQLVWTWDGSKLLFYGQEKAWMVAPDGTGLTERDALVPPVSNQSPDGSWRVTSRRTEVGFWRQPADATRENPQWQQVTFGDEDCCEEVGWSPDGSKIVYTVGLDTEGCAQIWTADINSGETTQVTGPGTPNESQLTCPEWGKARWSPDGEWILFNDEGSALDVGQAMIVHPDGTGLRPLVADQSELPSGWFTSLLAWAPDSSAVAMTGFHDMGTTMFIVSVDGTELVEVTDAPFGVTSATDMTWAPGR